MKQLPRLSLLLFFIALPHMTKAEPWQFIKQKHGVNAYKKHIEGSTLYSFKGEGIINHPIEKVVALLLDNQHATEWIPKLIRCQELKTNNQWPKSFMQFSLFDAPWPIKDRYFFSRIDVSVSDNGNQVIIHYDDISPDLGLKEAPIPPNAILGKLSGSEYTLKRLANGKTHFSAISSVKPNGKIPNWLLNWVGGSMPFDSYLRMDKALTGLARSVPQPILDLIVPPKAAAHPSVDNNKPHP
ncbi:MAG: hypothetical protein OXE99_14740 [Cellvibrionales bacterium]|nr:hypothetical protein [Cellvibrionales bacterium]